MDLSYVVRYYIEKMLKEVTGMKAMLLDSETTRIVSTVYSQSEILEQEVYLVEKLDSDPGEQLLHLKAVCFLRPTRENVARLRKELRSPRYGEYHLFFTNRIEDLRLQDLAEVDLREMIYQVQEFFGDFAVLDPHHFAVPIQQNQVTLQPFTWDYSRSTDAVARMTEGLAALMLSLRRRFTIRYQRDSEMCGKLTQSLHHLTTPYEQELQLWQREGETGPIITLQNIKPCLKYLQVPEGLRDVYQRGSEMCEKLAQSLHHLTTSEERELFDFGKRGGETAPIIMILDRKEDPVTPLLLQWTYQAMVHELIGIHTNRVDLTQVPGWRYQAMVHDLIGIHTNRIDPTLIPWVKKDFQELVLSARQDDFYRRHMYSNFGDAGAAVKNLVDEFQRQTTSSQNINTIEDMQNFVENFSEFSAAQRNAGKHVTLMSELSRLVEARTLMTVSSTEQEVCCSTGNMSAHFEAVRNLIDSHNITDNDRMRLVLLYALRYERDGQAQISDLLNMLQDHGMPRQQLGLVRTMLAHAGADKRVGDLFSNRSFSSRFATMAKQSLRGVENVYTQHSPLLLNTLEALVKGRLKDMDFPYIDRASNSATPAKTPKTIMVFIVGGTTYEEARAIADLNTQGERNEGWSAGIRFLLGGTGVLNSGSFMDDLMAFMALN